ncbi:MAG: HNH endonuclease [Eubacteriales bacterium]|nr:HNH endonuclease [Eubacteriales bacterium]
MNTKTKKEILTAISENLAAFSPKFTGKFVCPICLELIDINELDRISEAHIIPKAAVSGEKLMTWLCTKCNNTFGHSFDKWFGEYINYQQKGSLLTENITKGKLSFNGIEYNGKVIKHKDSTDFIIIDNWNSPETLKALKEEAEIIGPKKLSINIPLLSKREEIDIGFITAAYLYGFTLFGYSWVLQKRFQIIRDLILRRKSINDVTNSFYISKIKDSLSVDSHWFGIAIANGEFIPCVKISKKTVFFTPSYNQEVIQLINTPGEVFPLKIQIINNISNKQYQKPLIYLIDDKVIILPDEIVFGDIAPDFVVVTNSENWKTKVLTQKIDYSNPPKISKEDTIIRIDIF